MTIDSGMDVSSGGSVMVANCLERVVGSWMCSELQGALDVLGELSQSLAQDRLSDFRNGSFLSLLNSPLNEVSCVSLVVPGGAPHYITAPLFLGPLSVHFTGLTSNASTAGSSMLQLPSIVCNYTADVDQERIFDLLYSYTDYVLYFHRSGSVVFDSVEIRDCPYPIRLNTVNKIAITNSTFG